MRTKAIFRLYKIEIKLFSHSIWNYYDTKHLFLKNLEQFKEQNRNVVGYKYIKGEYKEI